MRNKLIKNTRSMKNEAEDSSGRNLKSQLMYAGLVIEEIHVCIPE